MENERNYAYIQLEQVKNLLDTYEKFYIENQNAFKKRKIIERIIATTGLIFSLGVFLFGLVCIILNGFSDLPKFFLGLFLILGSFGIFTIVVALVAIQSERRELFFSQQEMEIYRENKNTFFLLNSINFPKDCMCSGFAREVLAELKKNKNQNIDEIYTKCKTINYDIATDPTAKFINKNRFFITKAMTFMGIYH